MITFLLLENYNEGMMTIEDIKEVLHSRPNASKHNHSSWSNIDPNIIIQRRGESNETEISPNLRTNRSTTAAARISPTLHVDLLIENSSIKFYASPYFYFPSRHSSIAQQIGSYLEVIEPVSVPIRIPLPRRISSVTTRHTPIAIVRKDCLCKAMASEQIANDHCNDCDENGVVDNNSNGGENNNDKDSIDGENGIDRDIGSDDCLVEDHSEITISKVDDQENTLPIVLIEEEEQDSAVSRPVLLTGIALEEIAGGYPIPNKNRGFIIKTLEGAAKFADHCSRANKYKTIEHLDLSTGILFYFD